MKLIRSAIHLILLLLFAPNFSLAQTQKIDSLQNLLKTANDTTQVNILRQLGTHSRSQNKEKSLEYGIKSLEKSIEFGFTKGEILALYQLGVTEGITGNYVESLSYLNRCLTLANQHKDFKTVKNVYGVLGIVYKQIGDYPTSQDYYLKSLKIVDSLQLNMDTSPIYSNLGVLYDLMGEQDKAIESYEKSLEVYTGPNKEAKEYKVLANLAVMDFSNEDYNSALNKFLKNHDFIIRENGPSISLCISYSNIGLCYSKLKQWDKGQDYLLKSLELAQQLSLKQQIVKAFQGLAQLKFDQKNFKEAIDYSNKNLKAIGALGQFQQKYDAHYQAYKINEAIGEFPKAIYHLNQKVAYKDSLLNETKIKEIQNLQIKHNVYIKDKELKENTLQLALLNTEVAQKNRRSVYQVIIIGLLFLSSILLYLRYRNKNRSNTILQEKNQIISRQNLAIEEMNEELEKRVLRAQMNPHFIFNSLNSIHHLINSGDKLAALSYLNKFSKLLRQVLESSMDINLILQEEIELLKIYVELESLRFDDSFGYTFHIDKNLKVYEHEIPMLLIQPYIENAIIHGLIPKEGSKQLVISFNDQEDYIECIIEDNGVGLNQEVKSKNSLGPSRGMSITAKRIEALKKFSKEEELIKIEQLNNGPKTGTRVVILIPKEK